MNAPTAALLLATLAAPPPAHGQPASPWRAEGRRLAVADGVAAALLALGAVGAHAVIQTGPERWQLAMDLRVQDLLAARGEQVRANVDLLSDWTVNLLTVAPLVDSLLVAGLGHRNGELALESTLVSLQALATTAFATSVLKRSINRERPYGGHNSFPSGHTSQAFTAAGLVCTHHARFPLYGSARAGAVACGASVVLAASVGVERMVADKHWATDVLAGASLGLFSGLVVPKALKAWRARPGGLVAPSLVAPDAPGLTYRREF